METLSLYELNTLVAEAVSRGLPDEYWVEAEVAEARESRGHCYIELVQKDAWSNTPVAKASAKCWRNKWARLGGRFRQITGQELHAGMKVMLRVSASFHEAYGFSWIVSDINPEYTLGDMARRRREIISRLKEEGVFGLQKELPFPMFAQRIAVVSSAGAAGYGDFCKQLADNAEGFRFTVSLFPAIMQGEQVEQSVIAALDSIYAEAGGFDAVVIIRGGGATSDLSGFDTLALAENVANFPLPVIVGIGHERDESVLDLISCVSVKTPTAAATYLVDNLKAADSRLNRCAEAVVRAASTRIEAEKMRVSRLASSLPMLFSVMKTRGDARIDRLTVRMGAAAQQLLKEQKHRVAMLQQRAKAQDPAVLLDKGYSITTLNGRAVTSSSQLKKGDVLITRFAEGTASSTVTETR